LNRTGCGYRHLTLLGALWSVLPSLVGLGFALLSGAVPKWHPPGVFLAESNRGLAYWFLTRRGYGAITFGRVVTSAIPVTPHLLMHESHHSRQYEVLGPYFLPIYLGLQARYGYGANPLEREAEACAVAAEELPRQAG
jgi:hypothetical protein